MRVALDKTLPVEDLWCGKVVGLGVDEETSIEVVDSHLDSEGLVGLNRAEIRGEFELGGRYVITRGDDTDRSWVAGACGDLFAIGNGLFDTRAEVDEVVGGGK